MKKLYLLIMLAIFGAVTCLSGHSSTGYFAPIEMRDIEVELAEGFGHARSAALNRELPVSRDGMYRKFSLPMLGKYDEVVLEK